MSALAPGMLLRCIKTFDPEHARRFDMNLPAVGAIVTVREVSTSVLGETIVRLEEFSNDHMIGRTVRTAVYGVVTIGSEPGLPADHFRPLDDTRLDQFRRHLTAETIVRVRGLIRSDA